MKETIMVETKISVSFIESLLIKNVKKGIIRIGKNKSKLIVLNILN
jgi:hypothetical protein